eukprot:1542051-Amphidinium_carterae.4
MQSACLDAQRRDELHKKQQDLLLFSSGIASGSRACERDNPGALLLKGGLKELYKKSWPFVDIYVWIHSQPHGTFATQSLSLLQPKGRWSSEKSLQHYLQLNLSATAYAALAVAVKSTIRELVQLASVILDPCRLPPLRKRQRKGLVSVRAHLTVAGRSQPQHIGVEHREEQNMAMQAVRVKSAYTTQWLCMMMVLLHSLLGSIPPAAAV